MKDIRNYIIIGLSIVVAFFAFNKCSDKNKERADKLESERNVLHKRDSILFERFKQNSLNLEVYKRMQASSEKRTDSLDNKLKEAKNDYYALSKKIRGGLHVGICDTVEVVKVLNQCDSVIAESERTIAQRDTTINILKVNNKEQSDMLDIARDMLSNKDKEIDLLDKAIKKERRRNKIKTVLLVIGDAIKDGLIIFGLRG